MTFRKVAGLRSGTLYYFAGGSGQAPSETPSHCFLSPVLSNEHVLITKYQMSLPYTSNCSTFSQLGSPCSLLGQLFNIVFQSSINTSLFTAYRVLWDADCSNPTTFHQSPQHFFEYGMFKSFEFTSARKSSTGGKIVPA